MAQKPIPGRSSQHDWWRYEFLVPKQYNDGDSVETLKFECLQILLTEFFEGYSQYAGSGGWAAYPEEEHFKYQVDVLDDQFNEKFFEYFRKVLERWFRQEKIWMTRTKIDVL
ncbi:MAG: hypothetical protein O2807_12810 [bacterium]|nr:hypothetical protein [bacterium]